MQWVSPTYIPRWWICRKPVSSAESQGELSSRLIPMMFLLFLTNDLGEIYKKRVRCYCTTPWRRHRCTPGCSNVWNAGRCWSTCDLQRSRAAFIYHEGTLVYLFCSGIKFTSLRLNYLPNQRTGSNGLRIFLQIAVTSQFVRKGQFFFDIFDSPRRWTSLQAAVPH